MAKYKCKNLGECDRANSGEVFEIVAGDDLKCPSCGIGSMLEIVKTPTGGSAASKLPLIITGAVVTVVLLAGGGYYFIAGSAGAPIASAPVETVLAPAPAPVEASAPTPDPTPTPAPEVPQPAQPSIAPTEVETKALRQESEKNLTTGDVASAEQASNKAAANEIIKLAIAKMAQGKLAEAESELMAARERDPKQTLVSYNMAVLRLKQGRKDEALKELEASFRDGFSYFDQMDKDTDLDGIRKDARFNELVALYRNKSSVTESRAIAAKDTISGVYEAKSRFAQFERMRNGDVKFYISGMEIGSQYPCNIGDGSIGDDRLSIGSDPAFLKMNGQTGGYRDANHEISVEFGKNTAEVIVGKSKCIVGGLYKMTGGKDKLNWTGGD